jgi:hypothetical protein
LLISNTFVYMKHNQYSFILSRGLYLRGQIEDRLPFTGKSAIWTREETTLSLGELISARTKWNLQLRGCLRVVLEGEKEFSMGWSFVEEDEVPWRLLSCHSEFTLFKRMWSANYHPKLGKHLCLFSPESHYYLCISLAFVSFVKAVLHYLGWRLLSTGWSGPQSQMGHKFEVILWQWTLPPSLPGLTKVGLPLGLATPVLTSVSPCQAIPQLGSPVSCQL